MFPQVLTLLDFSAGIADLAPPASDTVCVGLLSPVDASAVYQVDVGSAPAVDVGAGRVVELDSERDVELGGDDGCD